MWPDINISLDPAVPGNKKEHQQRLLEELFYQLNKKIKLCKNQCWREYIRSCYVVFVLKGAVKIKPVYLVCNQFYILASF